MRRSPLVEAGALRWDLDRLYLDRYHRLETQVCDDLTGRAIQPPPPVDEPRLVATASLVRGDRVSDEQQEAALSAARRWTTILTGGPGTGGSLAGTTRYLKEKSNGRVKSFLADPPGSVLHSYIQSGGKLSERAGGSITEGIGQGRVTDNLAPDLHLLDGSLHISDEKTIEMVYRCLDEEGLYLGASSCLNVVAAKEVARIADRLFALLHADPRIAEIDLNPVLVDTGTSRVTCVDGRLAAGGA